MGSVSRREMMRWAGAGVAALAAPGVLRAGQMKVPGDPEPVGDFGFETNPVKSVDVAEGVKVLQGPGGNVTVVVGEDGVAAMVDSGVPPRGADVASAVRAAARGSVPRTLVNTHWHFDHAGGNAAMVRAGVGTVVAHDNTLARMSSSQHNAFFGMDFPAAPEEARPTVTFPDRSAVRVRGRTLRLVHVPPAHTDGDVAVHVEEADVLVTGDLFSNGFYPFIDYSSGGSIDGMIAASDTLLAMAGEKTRVVPGHGAVGSRGDLRAFRDMLADVRERLAKLAAEGKSLDEAVKARPLADFDATWGRPFFHSSHFVRIAYPAMAARKS